MVKIRPPKVAVIKASVPLKITRLILVIIAKTRLKITVQTQVRRLSSSITVHKLNVINSNLVIVRIPSVTNHFDMIIGRPLPNRDLHPNPVFTQRTVNALETHKVKVVAEVVEVDVQGLHLIAAHVDPHVELTVWSSGLKSGAV